MFSSKKNHQWTLSVKDLAPRGSQTINETQGSHHQQRGIVGCPGVEPGPLTNLLPLKNPLLPHPPSSTRPANSSSCLIIFCENLYGIEFKICQHEINWLGVLMLFDLKTLDSAGSWFRQSVSPPNYLPLKTYLLTLLWTLGAMVPNLTPTAPSRSVVCAFGVHWKVRWNRPPVSPWWSFRPVQCAVCRRGSAPRWFAAVPPDTSGPGWSLSPPAHSDGSRTRAVLFAVDWSKIHK